MDYIKTLLFICPIIFFAGFVDAIAGGGGLISMPAYLVAGIPPHSVLGTNKFSSACGASSSLYNFIKSGNIHKESAIYSVAAALIGSAVGANLTLMVSDIYLKKLMIAVLPVVIVLVLVKRDFGQGAEIPGRKRLLTIAVATSFVIGAYDGFFGPGTGTFLILAFTSLLGFDILTASGNAKAVNWASNMSALVVFLINGKVLFPIAIPAAIANLLGGYIGSKFAINKGLRVIKPIFVGVILLLICKIVYDTYFV